MKYLYSFNSLTYVPCIDFAFWFALSPCWFSCFNYFPFLMSISEFSIVSGFCVIGCYYACFFQTLKSLIIILPHISYQVEETDEARKKFSNAKSISSAQFFGVNKASDIEASASLQKFSVCTVILVHFFLFRTIFSFGWVGLSFH